MQHTVRRGCIGGLFVACIFLGVPANAAKHGQPGMGMGPGTGTAHPMATMVHDMSVKLRELADQLSQGNLSADQQQRMAKHVKEMAVMMGDMSGMIEKSMVMEGDYMQKPMQEMRKRMDQLMKDMSGVGAKK
jgi:hypothetical protein